MSINKLTKTETAELCGVTIRTITNWVNENDMPRNPDDSFNGAHVVAWLTARVEEKAQGAGGALLNSESQKWMTAFRRERALMAKIEREKAEGQLISRDEAGAEWRNIVAVLCHGLELFADRLPPVLHGRNRYEMFEIIRDEVWRLRFGLFKNGRYTPPVDCEPWPEDTGEKAEMKSERKEPEQCLKKSRIGKASKKGAWRGNPKRKAGKKSSRGSMSSGALRLSGNDGYLKNKEAT